MTEFPRTPSPRSENLDVPPAKRTRNSAISVLQRSEKLETRLGNLLCCGVCLDLPRCTIYQCSNGHLMCAACFTHLLADARLRDDSPASCPNCRTVISKELCPRNLAVEKAVAELPAECQFCSQQLPRSDVHHHEANLCDERKVSCTYAKIGCIWLGPFHELDRHRESCAHPNKTGIEVLAALQRLEDKDAEQKRTNTTLFDLLSYEKLIFNDLQFKPFRTDEYITKVYFETFRFSALNVYWACKAFVNNNQRDPQLSSERNLSYQLVLKSKINSPMVVHFLVLPGPFGDMRLEPQVHHYEFNEATSESTIMPLSVKDSQEVNRLLSAKVINFRLIIFQMNPPSPQTSKS